MVHVKIWTGLHALLLLLGWEYLLSGSGDVAEICVLKIVPVAQW